MNLQVSLLLSALLSVILTVASQGFGQIYCGRRLATTLAYLCDNNLAKRSEFWHQGLQDEMDWPVITAHRAHRLGRDKRQVVAECCDKPCTLDELYTYCGE